MFNNSQSVETGLKNYIKDITIAFSTIKLATFCYASYIKTTDIDKYLDYEWHRLNFIIIFINFIDHEWQNLQALLLMNIRKLHDNSSIIIYSFWETAPDPLL